MRNGYYVILTRERDCECSLGRVVDDIIEDF